jgi:hypothetical protein
MYCPSCGKQAPDNSTFCLHCGKPMAKVTSTASVTEWDYKDFKLTWAQGKTGWVSAHHYAEPSARLYYWQNYQSMIMRDLQKLLDEGWRPIGEIGPAGINLRSFKSYDSGDIFIYAMVIVIVFGTFGLGILAIPFFWPSSYKYELIGFKVELRRPKK